jgi:antitoxin component YwqK of YwqJK toxin-antitoxin module
LPPGVVAAVELPAGSEAEALEPDATRGVAGTVLGLRTRDDGCGRYVEARVAVDVVLVGRRAPLSTDDAEVEHDVHVLVKLTGATPGCDEPAVRALGMPRLAIGARVVVALGDGRPRTSGGPAWPGLERASVIAPLFELPRVAASLPEPRLDVEGEQSAFVPRLPGVDTPKARARLGAQPRFEQRQEEVVDRVLGVVWQRGTAPRPLHVNESAWYCDALRLGGHDDWRLPTAVELEAFLDQSSAPPSLRDRDLFPTPADGFLWSRTDDDGSFVGALDHGAIVSTHYDDPNPYGPYVTRCVRAGDAPKTLAVDRFAPDGSTLIDALSGNQWFLPTPAEPATHADAQRVCFEGTFASHDDWRLATADETFALMSACPPALESWAESHDELEVWTSFLEPETPYFAVHRMCNLSRTVPRSVVLEQPGAEASDPLAFGLCVRELAAATVPPMEACPAGTSPSQGESELRCETAGVPDGPYRSFYPSGAPFEVGRYEKGKRSGPFTQYHELGGVWATGSYEAGELDGRVVVTRPTGNARAKLAYRAGVPEGAWTFADPSGREAESLAFADGKPGVGKIVRLVSGSDGDGVATYPTLLGLEHGVERTTDRKGRLSAEVAYAGGSMDGPFTFYDDDGGTTKGAYRDGASDGVWIATRADGTIASRATYAAGQLDGEFEVFDVHGASSLRRFKQGAMMGKFELHGADGKVTMRGDLDEEGTGTVRALRPDGGVDAEDRYLRGKRHGAQRSFHPDGKLRHEVSFENGKKSGAEVEYHRNGKVHSVVTYRDGVRQGPTRELSEDGATVFLNGAFADGLRDGPWVVTLPTGARIKVTFARGRAVSGAFGTP